LPRAKRDVQHADVRFLTIAAAAIATGGIGLASPARADSNDEQSIQAISGDGIVMDTNDAILQRHSGRH
jgi:hypothetical protein